jgi:hypothetical protein
MLASGYDFAIAFYCNTLAGKVKLDKKFRNAQWGWEMALLAVDAEGDHFVAPAKSSRILVRKFTTRV